MLKDLGEAYGDLMKQYGINTITKQVKDSILRVEQLEATVGQK